MTDLSELLSIFPGASMLPGKLGKNADNDSFGFFAINLLYECSRP